MEVKLIYITCQKLEDLTVSCAYNVTTRRTDSLYRISQTNLLLTTYAALQTDTRCLDFPLYNTSPPEHFINMLIPDEYLLAKMPHEVIQMA